MHVWLAFQSLAEAYSRCVSVLSKSLKPGDVAVSVCTHCSRCFAVAAQFPACRTTFTSMPQLVVDLIRILRFKVGEKSSLDDFIRVLVD